MEKKIIDGKAVKEFAEDVSHKAVELGKTAGEKAKPLAEKIGKGIKGLKPDSKASEEKFEAHKILNSVIEGAYCGCEVTLNKGIVLVGEKEISRTNCESYDLEVNSDVVNSTKEKFTKYRASSSNLLVKNMTEKYIVIIWRNGEKSAACVDLAKYDRIIKVLS